MSHFMLNLSSEGKCVAYRGSRTCMCNNHKKSNRELNQKLYYNLKNEDSSRV